MSNLLDKVRSVPNFKEKKLQTFSAKRKGKKQLISLTITIFDMTRSPGIEPDSSKSNERSTNWAIDAVMDLILTSFCRICRK